MKTRDQIYAQEATSLLRDVTMYQVLKKKQILSMYPGKEKKVENLLSYLVKQGRIYRSGEYYLAQPDGDKNIDHGLMAAVWVLIDFIDRVEYHSSGDYPAKVIFFADGEIYEVIHAAIGKEALINHILSDPGEEPSKFLILVDKAEQIPELLTLNVAGYPLRARNIVQQISTKQRSTGRITQKSVRQLHSELTHTFCDH